MLSYDTSFQKRPASSNGNTHANGNSLPALAGARSPDAVREPSILAEQIFLKVLCLERKRTERSHRPFVLMLLEARGLLKSGHEEEVLANVIDALSRSTRETDITGWYREDAVIGVIFTEIGAHPDGKAVTAALLGKVHNALAGVLSIEQINQVSLSFHVFPEDWDRGGPAGPADEILYPDLQPKNNRRRVARAIKKAMDIAGSLMALVCLSPLLALIALLIKLTSKGPVLFRQERLGHNGARFNFLKFRSMYVNSDSKTHEDFVKSFIAGGNGAHRPAAAQAIVYKIKADPRVTPIGRFLRRTSLDELPQFLNVLLGDMSLVGPRPPIPYEIKSYDIWHKDRLLAATPGITGLWQVGGRSKVKFDDMVRMDLEYARSWSLWLDIKILCRTPLAVVSTDGAY